MSIKLIRQDNIRAKNEITVDLDSDNNSVTDALGTALSNGKTDTLKQIEIKSIFYDFSHNTDFIV